jgi:hypothetical protein
MIIAHSTIRQQKTRFTRIMQNKDKVELIEQSIAFSDCVRADQRSHQLLYSPYTERIAASDLIHIRALISGILAPRGVPKLLSQMPNPACVERTFPITTYQGEINGKISIIEIEYSQRYRIQTMIDVEHIASFEYGYIKRNTIAIDGNSFFMNKGYNSLRVTLEGILFFCKSNIEH